MRVLIAPMAAMAETSGPFSRAAALSVKLMEKHHEVAMCAAEDVNYRKVEGVINYFAPVPTPLGLPDFIGKNVFKVVQKLGIQQKKKVNSYEEVLRFVGVLSEKHFREDIACIRRAIQDFKPDVVYAEFRIAAIVAAKMENVRVATGYSYPTRKEFACKPEYSKKIRDYLEENGLPGINSSLEIFRWADLKIVPSSYELEPIEDNDVVFTGPFAMSISNSEAAVKNKIITYMGNGTITPAKTVKVLTEAFSNTRYEVYIATEQVEPFKKDNIIVDRRFDFSRLMPEAVAFINHGGQNSIMTGILFGVPQIVCPGNVFERRYNGQSIEKEGAGICIRTEEFQTNTIKKLVENFESNPEYRKQAARIKSSLIQLGGSETAVKALENLAAGKKG